ncbi:hypothetical protein [Calidifontibacter indicus]|uniref:Uncharacterized protein n=1 Tax=Calidifontibacter indicus TaxID=419650 RepID=A0A3D9UJT6_9MICO|nr:hypothetical protein [Calidifontibacter indicus]REF29577.1 hypothetical protein DFJ65_0531 [Calidifontibacter indicus]
MNAGARIGLYLAALVLVFGAAFGIARAVVPQSVVTDWQQRSEPMVTHTETDSPAAPTTHPTSH